MRLDAHVHLYNEGTLEEVKMVAVKTGLTHFVGIMQESALGLCDKLDLGSVKGIPFHWIDLSADKPFLDIPVAGYKVHPRQGLTKDGRFFLANQECMGDICKRAANEHRPLLFHTDGDDPNPASVSMLAELALLYPQTTIIAGHAGVYTQECFAINYHAAVFEPMIEPLWRQNLGHFITIPNLFGDLTKFGMDFPWRSSDPLHRFKAFRKVVDGLSDTERGILVNKLFVGTDFPNFFYPQWEQNESLKGTDCVENSHIAFQHQCMHEAFGNLYDEDRMVRNFFALLPDGYEP